MTRRDLLGAAVGGTAVAAGVREAEAAPVAAPPEMKQFLLMCSSDPFFDKGFYLYSTPNLQDALWRCRADQPHPVVAADSQFTLLYADGVRELDKGLNGYAHSHHLWRVEWGLRTIYVAADDMLAACRAVGQWCPMGEEAMTRIERAGRLWVKKTES